MTSNQPFLAFLQLVNRKGSAEQSPRYLLTELHETAIGRDPRCQIVLDSNRYGIVSRRHACIRPSPSGQTWEICDLGSANGTFINGKPLQGCHRLQRGDRILLGQDGPEFVFELQPVSRATKTEPGDTVTFTQLFPIFSTGRDLTRKAYLIPASLTAIVVVILFFSQNTPTVFNFVLGAYIAGIAYYYVYQLCGKPKPWWLLVGCAAMTALLAVPLVKTFGPVFYGSFAGWVHGRNLLTSLVQETLGTGMLEELIKTLPILIAWGWGKLLKSPAREQIGVWEPLDGILLGTASAVGFTLLETLGLYVPNTVQSVAGAAKEAGYLAGLQLLIPRVLGSVSGHMAYTGYLGYFIGLSILKPRRRWKILAVGYCTSALLHGLWNSTGGYFFTQISPLAGFITLAILGILSYAFLAAAILKARALSPTRSRSGTV